MFQDIVETSEKPNLSGTSGVSAYDRFGFRIDGNNAGQEVNEEISLEERAERLRKQAENHADQLTRDENHTVNVGNLNCLMTAIKP